MAQKSIEERLQKLEEEMERQVCLHDPSHMHMGGKSEKSCKPNKKRKEYFKNIKEKMSRGKK